MYFWYQFLLSHFKILCCVHCCFFHNWKFVFFIFRISGSLFHVPPWLIQVFTHPWTSHWVTDWPRKLIGSITSSNLTSLSLRNDFSLEESKGFLKLLCGLLLLTGNHLKDLFWPRVYDIRRGTARIVTLILILDLLLCFRKVSRGINEPSLNQLHRYDTVIQTFVFC